MGWCSTTGIFDEVMDAVIPYIPEDKVNEVMLQVAKPLWEGDWDCESDSRYWNSHLVHIMHERGRIDDEDYQYYVENPFNNG